MIEPIRDPEMEGEKLTPNQLREKAISDARMIEIEAQKQNRKESRHYCKMAKAARREKAMVEPLGSIIKRWKIEIAEGQSARLV